MILFEEYSPQIVDHQSQLVQFLAKNHVYDFGNSIYNLKAKNSQMENLSATVRLQKSLLISFYLSRPSEH